jgi:hypothetical protein
MMGLWWIVDVSKERNWNQSTVTKLQGVWLDCGGGCGYLLDLLHIDVLHTLLQRGHGLDRCLDCGVGLSSSV